MNLTESDLYFLSQILLYLKVYQLKCFFKWGELKDVAIKLLSLELGLGLEEGRQIHLILGFRI